MIRNPCFKEILKDLYANNEKFEIFYTQFMIEDPLKLISKEIKLDNMDIALFKTKDCPFCFSDNPVLYMFRPVIPLRNVFYTISSMMAPLSPKYGILIYNPNYKNNDDNIKYVLNSKKKNGFYRIESSFINKQYLCNHSKCRYSINKNEFNKIYETTDFPILIDVGMKMGSLKKRR